MVEEACETRLVYLGDNLFGELKRKPLTMTAWPQVDIDEIQAARILHRDPNLMEMYIEHAASTDFNTQNTNIVRNVQTFLSPSDITTILPPVSTVFNTDYILENKVEPDIIDRNTVFTLTESMGSNLGEISFPSTVKDELSEMVEQVLSTHSPSCQLRCGIESRLESLARIQKDLNEQEPSPTESYSSEEASPLTPVTSSNGNSVISSHEVDANEVFCSQDISEGLQDISSTVMSLDADGQAPGEFSQPVTGNSSQDITGGNIETSQDVTSSQEVATILSTPTIDTMKQCDTTDVISICPIASNSCDAEIMDIDTAVCANVDEMNTDSIAASSNRLGEVSKVHTTYGNDRESTLCDPLITSDNISQEYITPTVIEPMGMISNSESNMSVLDCAIGTMNVSLVNTSTEALAGDLSGNMIDISSQEVTGLTTDSDPRVLLANASQNASNAISDSIRNMQVPRKICSQELPIQNSDDVTCINESSSVESREPLESSSQEVSVPDSQDVSISLVNTSSQESTAQSSQDETNPPASTPLNRETGSQEVTVRAVLCLSDVTSSTQCQSILDRQMETNYNTSNAIEPDLNKAATQNTEILQEVTNTEIGATHALPTDKLEINSELLVITGQKETILPVGETVSPSNKNHYDSDTISYRSAVPDRVDNTDQCSENSNITDSSSERVLSVSNTRALRAKEYLSSIGLLDEIYNVNLSTYYPLVSQDDDLDFINFADIVNNSCSVSLDNLSTEDIKFEQELLKSSSPVRSGEITSSTHSIQSDNEKMDPTYGSAKKVKPSLRQRRKPSSKRIAAQRLINKTRQKIGTSKGETEYYPCKPSQSYERKLGGRKAMVKKRPVDTKTSKSKTMQDGNNGKRVRGVKGAASGLKIVHHGLKWPVPTPKSKGRRCKCDMCGEVFGTSTSFIEHYSKTHPALPCKDCSKVFTNLLSLQKHRYHHVGKKFPCDMCDRSFPFDSQLKDHRKSHFKTKPHVCSYPNCRKESTHLYDLKKHERTHVNENLKCS